jgi:hypothetical protein
VLAQTADRINEGLLKPQETTTPQYCQKKRIHSLNIGRFENDKNRTPFLQNIFP